MAVPFSRSTRSLAADNHRIALLGLASAMVLIVAWCSWFFFARITLYETSQDARLINGEEIVANYSKQTIGRIVRGQRALFHPDGIALEAAVAAVVNEVTRSGDSGRVNLILLRERSLPRGLAADATGQLDIEVERVSPARLVLRSAGLDDRAPVAPASAAGALY